MATNQNWLNYQLRRRMNQFFHDPPATRGAGVHEGELWDRIEAEMPSCVQPAKVSLLRSPYSALVAAVVLLVGVGGWYYQVPEPYIGFKSAGMENAMLSETNLVLNFAVIGRNGDMRRGEELMRLNLGDQLIFRIEGVLPDDQDVKLSLSVIGPSGGRELITHNYLIDANHRHIKENGKLLTYRPQSFGKYQFLISSPQAISANQMRGFQVYVEN